MRNPLAAGLRKSVTITCIPLVGRRAQRRRFAPTGQMITQDGIDMILQQEAEIVERFFPGAEFHLVPLRDGNFNFVQVGAAPIVDESSSSEVLEESISAS